MKTKLLILFSIAFINGANAQLTKILDFEVTTTGSVPHGSLISDGTFLYGMTQYGGNYFKGTIFKINPDGTDFSKIYEFGNGVNGANPRGDLFFDGTFLYGMTSLGGAFNLGTIFKIKPNGTEYTQIHDFLNLPDGATPWGSLISDGNFLYGMTSNGGLCVAANCDPGTIFKIKPDGTSYERIFDFDGFITGDSPVGSLILQGTNLYGMTAFGGSNDDGVVFKITTDGTGFVKLLDLDGTYTGAVPVGSLFSDGIFLYGMTKVGGTNQDGVIFKIKSDGTAFTKLLDFGVSVNGKAPHGSLVSDGSFLYGNTSIGVMYGAGTIFKLKTDGTEYVNLYNLSSTDGSNPRGSFLSDGAFLYGLTSSGGINSCGTIIKYEMNSVGITENFSDSEVVVYPNPSSGTLTITLSEAKVASSGDADYFIVNELGQKIKSIELNASNKYTVNVENLSNGVYFVVGSSNSWQKIVVSN